MTWSRGDLKRGWVTSQRCSIRGKGRERSYPHVRQSLIKGCSWGLCRGENRQGRLALLGATGRVMARKVWLLVESTPRTTLTASARVTLKMEKPFKGNNREFWFSYILFPYGYLSFPWGPCATLETTLKMLSKHLWADWNHFIISAR